MIKKDVTEILKFITQLENGENLQKLSYSESEEYLNPIIDKLNLIVDKRNKKYHSFSELILNIVTDNCEEQNLINQKKSFQNLLDVLDKIVLISITDLSGNIIFANDKFCEVSGYLREELLGKNHRIVKSDYHTPEFYKNFWTTISGGLVWHGEICNQKKDRNNYWVDSVITAMRDENNNIIQYLSVGFVVTTCKKLEHYTQQSSKLVLLGEMASGIAHEIKNPLFFISGTLSQLPKLLSEPDKFNLKVDKLKQACERITRFTNGLTKYSRKKDKKNYQQCFLSSIIEETFLLIFEKIREHEVTITFDNKSESPILCDEIEIEQVFVNLIINAIDAVKNLEKRWIKISLLDETSFIVCRIIDSGSGISEEIRQKMFDLFFTTKPIGQGTGLGLSIIKEILERHNSTIDVDTKGENTCFEIRFPMIDKSNNITLRVFYLDDEKDLCSNFFETFATHKINIKTYTDPNDVIKAAKENPPDLIFIDFRLAGITGDKVVEMMDKKIPKFLITGEIQLISCYKFEKIISKPLKVKEILEILDEYKNKKLKNNASNGSAEM